MKMNNIPKIVIKAVLLLAILILSSCMYVLKPYDSVLINQLGRIVDTKEAPGLYFKLPFIQSTRTIYKGERLYDLAASDVITSDKKSMIADCYVIWQVENPLKFYQTLSSDSVAESRIDVAVYNAMKNVISSTKQDDVISGKDGTLDQIIMSKIDSVSNYGINLSDVEMKRLDLPDENRESVYTRMISERGVVASQFKAEGEREAEKIRNNFNSEVRILLAEAETNAAKLEAEGDSQYFEILADAYNSSDEKRDFYQFIIGLNAMKESLKNGGTIVLDKESPLYEIVQNK